VLKFLHQWPKSKFLDLAPPNAGLFSCMSNGTAEPPYRAVPFGLLLHLFGEAGAVVKKAFTNTSQNE